MQLTKTSKMAASLALASCQLIGAAPAQASAEKSDEWQFDTAILYYGETDRISLVEGMVSATKDFGDDHIFNGKLTYDALTGASATGAVPQDYVQTFSRPSGHGQYQVAPNTTPLDDTFRDSRVQLNAQWTQPMLPNLTGSTGVHASKEYDYLSLGLNGSLAYDLNQKNTTLSVGLSYQMDSIDPVGGAPTPLSSLPLADNAYSNDNDEYVDDDDFEHGERTQGQTQDKDTVDLLLGVTQVISRNMLMQFTLGLSKSDGYLNDPYKYVSVVNNLGTVQDTLYESRPDSRTKQTVYWQTKYAKGSFVGDVSYRYMQDDWEMTSHTIDSRLRFDLGNDNYIQPHLRYYQQGAVDFYRPFLLDEASLPAFVTADYRLGEMDAMTIGLKYGQTMNNGHNWAIRVEYYQQNPKNAGFIAPGSLQNQELYPSIKAMMVQFNYSF